jgi:nitroreductase
MELMEAIRGRRSVRAYTDARLTRPELDGLLDAAVQAPSALNRQSWRFAVIEDQVTLQRHSDGAKRLIAESMAATPMPAELQHLLADPAFHIFYHAPALVVIYASARDEFAPVDCCLAAQNLMLAAHAQGLGSCWIGFAHAWLDRPDVKDELGVSRDWTAVAPIIVGHPKGPAPSAPARAKPVICHWG